MDTDEKITLHPVGDVPFVATPVYISEPRMLEPGDTFTFSFTLPVLAQRSTLAGVIVLVDK